MDSGECPCCVCAELVSCSWHRERVKKRWTIGGERDALGGMSPRAKRARNGLELVNSGGSCFAVNSYIGSMIFLQNTSSLEVGKMRTVQFEPGLVLPGEYFLSRRVPVVPAFFPRSGFSLIFPRGSRKSRGGKTFPCNVLLFMWLRALMEKR